jgi:hypothetical protein
MFSKFYNVLVHVVPSCPMYYCNRSSSLSNDTSNKNTDSRRGNIILANKHMVDAFVDMEKWITRGNWKNSGGLMFLNFRDIMGKYKLRLPGQLQRQSTLITSAAHDRTTETALHLFLKEPRRADTSIPAILRPLNTCIQQSPEYAMIDVKDFMTCMNNSQRHYFLLTVHEGMSVPIFNYTWSRGGSRAGVNPHVIWRVPLNSEQEQRAVGLRTSQNNIDYLILKNKYLSHTSIAFRLYGYNDYQELRKQ